ncbi:LEA type 2 family protein [Fulvivirga ulvae]|uniref:LEA type 2 family protein n=1 Tax=Fulvivirga ulvae TaxID=2904245 RepID=UPI001F396A25|nr:LEA type 2 family protein [Fulvivirga ulvae]UII34057.1 LEA type 2 family protein [Fulvivirga ulvae]
MKYKFLLVVLLSVFLLAYGCKHPEDAPVFRRVGNIEVTKVTGSEAYLNANAYFYNPNDVKMRLKKVEVDVEVEGNKIGTINHSVKTLIPANSEFKVPLDATFDMKQMGFLKSVISILGGKKVKVHYKGFIRVSFHGFPIKVPVDYEDEVRI